MSDYNEGGLVRRPNETRVTSQGVCPLDGYPLIEIADMHATIQGEQILVEGGWDHVIPAKEIRDAESVRQRIAEAHAFEVVVEAERIAEKGTGL